MPSFKIVALTALIALCACADPSSPFDPTPSCPEQACSDNSGCLEGFVCTNGACALPVSCGQTPGCPQDGFPYGWNDCLWTGCNCYANDLPPPPPPAPDSCGETATCTTAPPSCAAGEIPTLYAGCYDGTCRSIAGCDVPPPCSALAHEGDCTARSDCEALYQGLDCTAPGGGACMPGDAQCTCKTYEFSSCRAR